MPIDITQLAAYFGYTVAACTVAHRVIAALRPVAAETSSKTDDRVLDVVEKAVSAIEQIVGALSVFKKAEK